MGKYDITNDCKIQYLCADLSLFCSTYDKLTNISDIHHRPALLWRFCNSGTAYKTCDLLT